MTTEHNTLWTEDEDNVLRDHIADLGVTKILEMKLITGRTRAATCRRVYVLGLTRRPAPKCVEGLQFTLNLEGWPV